VFGVQDRIIGLPKGEKNAALPEFLSEFKDDKLKEIQVTQHFFHL
jgi:iron complex transport system substrate-binding protein